MGNQGINELWHRFKSGDNDALSKLYNLYVHKLFSYGLKINGDEYLVKDCIQEVFIQLIDKRKTLKLSDSTSIYLFKSLRNKLLEELRSKNRRTDISKSISFDDDRNEMSAEQSIVSSEEEHLRAKIIEKALNSLSDYQKEAIFLKYSQGFDYKKIAEILEIDIASARTLIYRSLKLVKESINGKIQILFFFFRSLL
ncbi:MAG TPA: sigma-70 family RNA polymerase sigma factor [Prolixibacteraceae bacterium]|nr:sigma-70 family RNA polymerase sigma factor [Prolixibacteraceae bacterium]